MKQVEVTILGQSYILGCPADGEAALHKAVAAVDQEMSAIRDAGKIKARERMAVLAALNLAYKWVESQSAGLATSTVGAPAVGTPSSAADLPSDAEATGGVSHELGHLIQRLDEALADDGQLI